MPKATIPLVLVVALGCTAPNPAFELAPDGAPHGDGSPEAAAADLPGADALPGDVPDARGADIPEPADAPGDRPAAEVRADATAEAGRPPDLTTGLVGYWPLDEGTGSTIIADRSGNASQGTIVGLSASSAWKAGKVGSALEVPDVMNASVTVKPTASINSVRTALTIAAWVYRNANISGRQMAVVSRQLGTGSRELYNLAFRSDTLILWIDPDAAAASFNVVASRPAPLATWIHVAATWDGGVVRLYQDGAEVGSASYAAVMPDDTNNLLLGNNVNLSTADQPLVGRLDEVRLYNRALSAAEIAALAR
jgi:hypothetical protein